MQTCFYVWAPTAIELTLNIFDHWYDTSYEMLPLSRKETGIWTITLPGNHEVNGIRIMSNIVRFVIITSLTLTPVFFLLMAKKHDW
ncbi:hypothetical protein [Bacillus sp. JCM 19041]|uniref:hypothetical protein n=1 Tax=Bacillus sp. JCM 19041 TaxID=1460637 RepID=UPI0009EBD2B6